MKNDITLPPFMRTGWSGDLGSHLFSAEEIIEFAEDYDPQIFHLDPVAAEKSLLGGLCASGWHTASVWMRQMRETMAEELARLESMAEPLFEFGPSPGFEKLHWYRPVYTGDTIAYSSETLECRPSRSKPGWYLLKGLQSATNEKGDPVISFESVVLVKYPA